MDFFICEFKIRGPKWRNLSTSNNEWNLYMKMTIWKRCEINLLSFHLWYNDPFKMIEIPWSESPILAPDVKYEIVANLREERRYLSDVGIDR